MRIYDTPSEMFETRAKNAKKKGDVEYAQYKQAKDNGNKDEAQKHYLKSQREYEREKEEREKEEKYKGKTWDDLKNKEQPQDSSRTSSQSYSSSYSDNFDKYVDSSNKYGG